MSASAVDGYHDADALASAISAAAARMPGRATISEFGRSVEGRPLDVVTVTGGGSTAVEAGEARPLAMVIATIHGCEVIASELALRLVEEVTAPEPATDVAALLAVADVAIVPVVNPDSRAQSLASLARRGPLRLAPRRNARGVDLNRNWPWVPGARDHWSPLAGTSRVHTPWYRGPHPLSEPETKALADLVDLRPPVVLLNLHSTGRIVTHPWACRPEAPDDLDRFTAVIDAFRAAQTRWTYRAKQSNAWYPIVGSSNDWLYSTHGTLAITVETGVPGGAVRRDVRHRAGTFFWYANPDDPEAHVANDTPACLAALRAGTEARRAPR